MHYTGDHYDLIGYIGCWGSIKIRDIQCHHKSYFIFPVKTDFIWKYRGKRWRGYEIEKEKETEIDRQTEMSNALEKIWAILKVERVLVYNPAGKEESTHFNRGNTGNMYSGNMYPDNTRELKSVF